MSPLPALQEKGEQKNCQWTERAEEGWRDPRGRAPSPVSLEAGLEEEGQSALHLKGQAPDLNRRIQNTEFWGRKKKKSKWKEEESFDPG